MKTERVIVFKDGYCLIIKKGIGTTDKNGNLYLTEIPDSASMNTSRLHVKKF